MVLREPEKYCLVGLFFISCEYLHFKSPRVSFCLSVFSYIHNVWHSAALVVLLFVSYPSACTLYSVHIPHKKRCSWVSKIIRMLSIQQNPANNRTERSAHVSFIVVWACLLTDVSKNGNRMKATHTVSIIPQTSIYFSKKCIVFVNVVFAFLVVVGGVAAVRAVHKSFLSSIVTHTACVFVCATKKRTNVWNVFVPSSFLLTLVYRILNVCTLQNNRIHTRSMKIVLLS